MRIALASDHAGRNLRATIRKHLEILGHEVSDLGSDTGESDYPDFAAEVGRRVAESEVDRGVLCCGTGWGMTIAANKIRGVRAILPYEVESTRLSRLHNDSNVACFGERTQSPDDVLKFLEAWLDAEFETEPRHVRRVGKITLLERNDLSTRPQ